MKSFKDTKGREWTIDLNVQTLRRIKAIGGVDLMDLVSADASKDTLIHNLVTDVYVLCDVLWAICKPIAEEKNITEEDFGSSLGGKVMTETREALFAEIENFFHEAGPTIRKTANKLLTVYRKALRKIEQKVDAVNEDEMLEEALALMTFGQSSGNLPESSE